MIFNEVKKGKIINFNSTIISHNDMNIVLKLGKRLKIKHTFHALVYFEFTFFTFD